MILTGARRRYPVRYWLCVLFGVGVPGLTKFDRSNLTHDLGLFNQQSIATIVHRMLCIAILVALTLTNRTSIQHRKVKFKQGLWFLLMILLFVVSAVGPDNNLLLSIYRLSEWIFFYFIVASLYTRENQQDCARLIIDVIEKTCWICTLFVLFMLPISPTLAFGNVAAETGLIQWRFGGSIYDPNALGVLAGIAVWIRILLYRGRRRVVGAGFMVIIMLITYSRGAWAGFALASAAYVIVRGSRAIRFSVILGISLGALGLPLYGRAILEFLSRGQDESNLTTLSDRTAVWSSAVLAIAKRPWLGYGYIDGPKKALAQFFSESFWAPIHAHDELLQAVLSGGFLCGLLVISIYFIAIYSLFKQTRQSKHENPPLVLFLAMIQVFAFSIVTPVLMRNILPIGAVMILCLFPAFDQAVCRRTTTIAIYEYEEEVVA